MNDPLASCNIFEKSLDYGYFYVPAPNKQCSVKCAKPSKPIGSSRLPILALNANPYYKLSSLRSLNISPLIPLIVIANTS